MSFRATTAALALAFGVALAVPDAVAQQSGRQAMGTITVLGHPDSLFVQFVTYLRTHNSTVTAIDNRRRLVTANIPAVEDEGVGFRFDPKGDSTTISAQGTRGGMLALIMGLGQVHDMLQAVTPKPDTSGRPAAPVRQPPPPLEQRPN